MNTAARRSARSSAGAGIGQQQSTREGSQALLTATPIFLARSGRSRSRFFARFGGCLKMPVRNSVFSVNPPPHGWPEKIPPGGIGAGPGARGAGRGQEGPCRCVGAVGRGHGWALGSLRSITGGGGHGIHCSAVNRNQKVATPATPRPGGGWSRDLFHCNGSGLLATPTTPIYPKQEKQRERGQAGIREQGG